MPTDHRAKLATIRRFDQLVAYLRDEMGWPIARDSFEDVDDLFYDFTAEELGIDPKTAAKIQEIKRLRPLSPKQPWGIFFVKFEPKRLPVVALRRILGQVALKKRASANSAERAAWAADDLLFVSNYGEGEERQISFAHFSRAQDGHDLPTLKVLGWDNRDTALHLDAVARDLSEHLSWPDDDGDAEAWRARWRAAFTLGHREVVTTAKELSSRLAELACNIRDRIRTALAIETDKGPLTRLMKAFQEALVHDLDADGFADMYAQTIAYGLLSARITDPSKRTANDFTVHMRTNPFLKELMEAFLHVGGRRGTSGGPGIDFDELGVSEVTQLLDSANMEAVVRDFGDRNPQEDPVIHFYEHFLASYDKEQKVARGVFYTPRPVVSFIVRSVHELLISKFGLEDGLADTATWKTVTSRNSGLEIPPGVSPDAPFVTILDPAVGTGTFLVEIIQLVYETLTSRWQSEARSKREIRAEWTRYVDEHLIPRLYGYELLMAPYAIAHMKVALKLHETGYDFSSSKRLNVFLTDSLEPARDYSSFLSFAVPALADEAQAVASVKQNVVFSVVLGNPPYLREKVSGPGERKDRIGGWVRFGDEDGNGALLDDFIRPLSLAGMGVHAKLAYELSVMFWRLALWLAFDRIGTAGIVGMISPRAYIAGPGHSGMRDWMRRSGEQLFVLDLGGDNRGTRKSENVFDIETGVAIGICLRTTQDENGDADVRYSEVEGSSASKLATLSGASVSSLPWTSCDAKSSTFLPGPVGAYGSWPLLSDLFPWQHSGTQFKRLWPIGESRQLLERRWTTFLSLRKQDRAAAFVETDARLVAAAKGGARGRKYTGLEEAAADTPTPPIRRYCYRALDRQWAFVDERFADRLRPDLVAVMGNGQLFAATLMSKQLGSGPAVTVTNCLPDMDVFCNRGAKDIIPLWRDSALRNPNLHPDVLRILSGEIGREVSPEELFAYCMAVLGGPAYTERFKTELTIPGPRVPVTLDRDLFMDGVKLGSAFVQLQTFGDVNIAEPVEQVAPRPRRAHLERAVSEEEDRYPEAFEYSPEDRLLSVGDGLVADVAPEVFNFVMSGFYPVHSWLRYRMKERSGRAKQGRSRSVLDTVRPLQWTFTPELLDLLWTIEGCIALGPELDRFLTSVICSDLLGSESLGEVPPHLRKPPKQGHTGPQGSLLA